MHRLVAELAQSSKNVRPTEDGIDRLEIASEFPLRGRTPTLLSDRSTRGASRKNALDGLPFLYNRSTVNKNV